MIYSTQSDRKFPIINHANNSIVMTDNGWLLDFTGANLTVIHGYKSYDFPCSPNWPGRSWIEDEVCELLKGYLGRDQYKFFKNGTDAVSCAMRLARYCRKYKSVDQTIIAFMGYHGTNNEYVATFNVNGITHIEAFQVDPDIEVAHLMSTFTYEHDNTPKAHILVYESRFQEIADKIDAEIKICDHLKSGVWGLEETTADIDLYGKSIGNGYPIAFMTGKKEYMDKMDKIYYSTTFGGENHGLLAIKYSLEEFELKKDYLRDLRKYADEVLPKWQTISQDQINEFIARGLLYNGYWQVMSCHTKEDISKLAEACNAIM